MKIYRRVGNDEQNRGNLYPIFHEGMETFAHFGIGIGIYFSQLVVLAIVSFICGMIMLTGAYEYQKTDFGDPHKPVPFSAVCYETNVTATIGCDGNDDGNSSCIITYRPNCDLQLGTVIADYFMCIIFVIVFFASKFVEQRIEEKLDETVQTSQDYSVEVLDPNDDADDPDEWYRFFKQFGTVRYITIIRRNSMLTDLIMKKHTYTRKLQESGKLGSKLSLKREQLDMKYEEVNAKLREALDDDEIYPVCRVYVTFENEEDQRTCLKKLQMPYINTFLDMKAKFPRKYRFRKENVLKIQEPPEPDNIIWRNLEVAKESTYPKKVASFLLSLGLMITFWFLLMAVKQVSSRLMAVVIGLIDASLPALYNIVSDMTFPENEGTKQSRLQMRLFGARLLLSTIIPYIQTAWDHVLTSEFLQQVLTIQLTTCFTAPIFALIDMPGLFQRHFMAPSTSDTQEEMNNHYLGSEWSLAEKYTGIAKVIFISLFYSLLTPISILVSTFAFLAIFIIDNFLLLRRWKAASMLDSKIATRLRQQAILAVAAHMYVTMRLIYSWPMDQAYWNETEQTYEKVDKYPSYSFWDMTIQPWHSTVQRQVLVAYQIGVFLVGSTALYMLVIEPFGTNMYRWFCNSYSAVGQVQNIPFSKIPNMKIYYPILQSSELKYLCSYTKNVLQRHRPALIESGSFTKDDLSCYVPIDRQREVLSIVKYFGDYAADSILPEDAKFEVQLAKLHKRRERLLALGVSPKWFSSEVSGDENGVEMGSMKLSFSGLSTGWHSLTSLFSFNNENNNGRGSDRSKRYSHKGKRKSRKKNKRNNEDVEDQNDEDDEDSDDSEEEDDEEEDEDDDDDEDEDEESGLSSSQRMNRSKSKRGSDNRSKKKSKGNKEPKVSPRSIFTEGARVIPDDTIS